MGDNVRVRVPRAAQAAAAAAATAVTAARRMKINRLVTRSCGVYKVAKRSGAVSASFHDMDALISAARSSMPTLTECWSVRIQSKRYPKMFKS